MSPSFSRHAVAGHREFGVVRALVTLAALSPFCAVSGLMLAQVLGFVPY